MNKQFRSVLLHLRLPFSLLLLPVFLFALANVPIVNNTNAVLVFIILHFLVYPASNGYNSYFDKDEGSIALIKTPPKVNRTLYITSISLEWIAVLLALLVNFKFFCCVLLFNFLSKAYSHPSVRLKKYPVISFLVVFIFQGGFIYYTCYTAITLPFVDFYSEDFIACLVSSCLIGASYPLTQIYQHEEDSKRGDHTLSLLLGYKGSFLFSAVVFFIGLDLMFYYWMLAEKILNFYVFAICTLPILFYFVWWFLKVLKDVKNANFMNAMRMTLISGVMMLVYFGWLVVWG